MFIEALFTFTTNENDPNVHYLGNGREIVVFMQLGIHAVHVIFSNKKELTTDTHSNTAESQMHYAK